jgi:hypothetical protein
VKKKPTKAQRKKALRELTRLSQEWGMYSELNGPPPRSSKQETIIYCTADMGSLCFSLKPKRGRPPMVTNKVLVGLNIRPGFVKEARDLNVNHLRAIVDLLYGTLPAKFVDPTTQMMVAQVG